MFGPLLDLSTWVLDLSPFQHTPAVPADPLLVLPLALLTTITIGLIAVATDGVPLARPRHRVTAVAHSALSAPAGLRRVARRPAAAARSKVTTRVAVTTVTMAVTGVIGSATRPMLLAKEPQSARPTAMPMGTDAADRSQRGSWRSSARSTAARVRRSRCSGGRPAPVAVAERRQRSSGRAHQRRATPGCRPAAPASVVRRRSRGDRRCTWVR